MDGTHSWGSAKRARGERAGGEPTTTGPGCSLPIRGAGRSASQPFPCPLTLRPSSLAPSLLSPQLSHLPNGDSTTPLPGLP